MLPTPFKRMVYLVVILIIGVGTNRYPIEAQDDTPACTPIALENAAALTLFFESAGFAQTKYLIVFDTLAWSPDSTRLSLAGMDFYIQETLPLPQTVQPHPAVNIYQPDGTPLIVRLVDRGLDVLDGASGELIHHLDADSNFIAGMAISREGRLVAFGDSAYQIQVWNMLTGEHLITLAGHEVGIPIGVMAFSPDGTLLVSGAAGGVNTQPLLWDIGTGAVLYDFAGFDNVVWDIAFSPAGNLLAVNNRNGVSLVDITDVNQPQTTTIEFGVAVEVRQAAFNPDGTVLAVAGVIYGAGSDQPTYFLQLWEVATQTLLREWDFEAIGGLAFSPDGCWLAGVGLAEGSGVTLSLWRIE